MRKLVLEISQQVMAKSEPHLLGVKSFEVLRTLRQEREDFALVCRLEFKDLNFKVSDFFPFRWMEWQILEQKNNSFVVFVKGKPPVALASNAPFFANTGAFIIGREIKDGKGRITILGTRKQVREYLAGIQRSGDAYKVISLMDAKFSTDSPFTLLTEKQDKFWSRHILKDITMSQER